VCAFKDAAVAVDPWVRFLQAGNPFLQAQTLWYEVLRSAVVCSAAFLLLLTGSTCEECEACFPAVACCALALVL
jgi:hypothetical protein